MHEEQMPMMAYLETLRKSLIIAGSTWLVAFVVLYGFADRLFSWVAEPMRQVLPAGSSMVFLSVTEPFFTYLLLASVAALGVSLPVILWQVWILIVCGLHLEEKGTGVVFVLVSCMAFISGAYLGFRFVLPAIFSVLVRFGTDSGSVTAMLSMGDYLSLALKMILAFGLVFELPVLMIVLTRLGVADSHWFASKRKYMLIVAFVFGALITPGPDVLSQCSIAIPFVILYEVGILGGRFARKKPCSGTCQESV
jgi:sec-independent protein translocase protein TatC